MENPIIEELKKWNFSAIFLYPSSNDEYAGFKVGLEKFKFKLKPVIFQETSNNLLQVAKNAYENFFGSKVILEELDRIKKKYSKGELKKGEAIKKLESLKRSIEDKRTRQVVFVSSTEDVLKKIQGIFSQKVEDFFYILKELSKIYGKSTVSYPRIPILYKLPKLIGWAKRFMPKDLKRSITFIKNGEDLRNIGYLPEITTLKSLYFRGDFKRLNSFLKSKKYSMTILTNDLERKFLSTGLEYIFSDDLLYKLLETSLNGLKEGELEIFPSSRSISLAKRIPTGVITFFAKLFI